MRQNTPTPRRSTSATRRQSAARSRSASRRRAAAGVSKATSPRPVRSGASHNPARSAGRRGGSVHVRPSAEPTPRTRTAKHNRKPASALDAQVRIPLPDNVKMTLTRRQLLFGALGLGAVAGVAAGGAAFMKASEPEEEISVLTVPEDAVFTTADCATPDAADCMALTAQFELPYGTLIWANSNDYAACLIPTDVASPLTEGAVLMLGSGDCETILPHAVSDDGGFEIYDIRCNGSGVIWTEADCLAGTWRVYQASYSPGNGIGTPQKVEEGATDFEPPHIAIAGSRVFWQVLPNLNGDAATQDSLIKCATIGSSEVQEVLRSHGRPASPLYACEDAIIATPRADTSGVYHVLSRIDANSLAVTDTLTLPASMKPLEAGFGNGRFAFCFDAIYDYGGGIANLGTYVPAAEGDPDSVSWFRFDRTPTAAPAWCGRWFMVKSSRSVSGVDAEGRQAFSLGAPDGCDDYGDYLATSGSFDNVVTYSNIDTSTSTTTYQEGTWDEETGTQEDGQYVTTTTEVRHTLVRVWTPVA